MFCCSSDFNWYNPIACFGRIFRDTVLIVVFIVLTGGLLIGWRCVVAAIDVYSHNEAESSEEISELISLGDIPQSIISLGFSSMSSGEEKELLDIIRSHQMWDWGNPYYWGIAVVLVIVTYAVMAIPFCVCYGGWKLFVRTLAVIKRLIISYTKRLCVLLYIMIRSVCRKFARHIYPESKYKFEDDGGCCLSLCTVCNCKKRRTEDDEDGDDTEKNFSEDWHEL